MAEILREPERDCILYKPGSRTGASGCRGLNMLYCQAELQPCPFYKPKNRYDSEGKPLRKDK